MTSLVAYAVSFIVFVGIDLIWLGFVAYGYYRSQIGHLLGPELNLGAAAAFYLIYVLGVVIFAVLPAVAAGGPMRALLMGALFGFFCYATYDLTNMATLKNWPLQLSIVDMAWGAFLTGITAAAGTYAADRFS
jgi:uncharacterized membrane protein